MKAATAMRAAPPWVMTMVLTIQVSNDIESVFVFVNDISIGIDIATVVVILSEYVLTFNQVAVTLSDFLHESASSSAAKGVGPARARGGGHDAARFQHPRP